MRINSPRYRRATLVLLILALACQLLDHYWYRLFPVAETYSLEQRQMILQRWEKADSLQHILAVERLPAQLEVNQLDYDQLVLMGLSDRLARRFLSFRASLGTYRDLAQIYAIHDIDSQWVSGWSDRLKFPPPQYDSYRFSSTKKMNELKPDSFDPNTVSEAALLAMGLPSFKAKGIIAFREKFRPFKRSEDLYQVYNLDSLSAQALMPYLIVSDSLSAEKSPGLPLALNASDTTQFKTISGIGSFTAQALVDYRTRLGGFCRLEQLEELFFVDSIWMRGKSAFFYLDSVELKKLNLNLSSLEELQAHPYISYYLARNIVEFRERIRLFKRKEELMNIELVDDVLFRKLAPYLEVSLEDMNGQ